MTKIDYNKLTPLEAVNLQTLTNKAIADKVGKNWNNDEIKEFNTYTRFQNNFYKDLYTYLAMFSDFVKDDETNLAFAFPQSSELMPTSKEIQESYEKWKKSVFYTHISITRDLFLSKVVMRLKGRLTNYYFLKDVLEISKQKTGLEYCVEDINTVDVNTGILDTNNIINLFSLDDETIEKISKGSNFSLRTKLMAISFKKESLSLLYMDILKDLQNMTREEILALSVVDLKNFAMRLLEKLEVDNKYLIEIHDKLVELETKYEETLEN